MYEPFYQILRLHLLADAMTEDADLALTDARVIVICPEGNTAYRNTITSPRLKERFPKEQSVTGVVKAVLKQPDLFSIVDPTQLIDAVRQKLPTGSPLQEWSQYFKRRYGW